MDNSHSNGTVTDSWQHALSEFLKSAEDFDEPDDHFQVYSCVLFKILIYQFVGHNLSI